MNRRSECLGTLLEKRGYSVTWTNRNIVVPDTELTIQTCFAPSPAIHHAIDNQIPFLIMEAPHFRSFYDKQISASWAYNGLAGGGWRPHAGIDARPRPELQPMRTEGKTLIIGQKPMDLSLRGSDHIQWLLDRFEEFPEADYRPHPQMIERHKVTPIEDGLVGYKDVILYNSTSVVDATIAGCTVRVDGPCSLGPKEGVSREEWIHDLSWSTAKYADFEEIVDNILGGYEEAKDRMQSGLHELARIPTDGNAIQQRYYRTIDHSKLGVWRNSGSAP